MAKTHEEAVAQVRNLLDLANCTGANPNEAASAVAMATRIMERYRIEQATLDASADDEAEEETQGWEEAIAKAGAVWRGTLAQSLAKCHGCYVYREEKLYKIVGRASDVQTVRYLYDYCHNEVQRLAEMQMGNGLGRTWLNNYRAGCVDAIRFAARAMKAAVRQQARDMAQQTAHDDGDASLGGAVVRIDDALQRIDQIGQDAENWANRNLRLRGSGTHTARGNAEARNMGRQHGRDIYPGGGSGGLGVGTRRLKG